MAKTTKTSTDKKIDNTGEQKKSWKITRQQKMLFGSLLMLFSIALLVAFISFYIHGQEDQSAVLEIGNKNETVNNWLGEEIHVMKVVGLNPSTVYWMDIFSHIFVVKIL